LQISRCMGGKREGGTEKQKKKGTLKTNLQKKLSLSKNIKINKGGPSYEKQKQREL